MKRIIKAFAYSYNGFVAAWGETAFRQEIILFVILLPVAIILPVSILAKGLLVSALVLILIAELANTAIETIIDRVSKARHPLSKKAKDIGSAIVLLSFINAGVIWAAALLSI